MLELELHSRLANILALSQSVADGRVAPRRVREYARLCFEEASRLARLLEDVASLADAIRANGVKTVPRRANVVRKAISESKRRRARESRQGREPSRVAEPE